MSDILAYENKMSIDELRREVRECWNRETMLAKALRDPPEMVDPWLLPFLSRGSKWPNDNRLGKLLQREMGLDAIPPKSECECGAGVWYRIRQGLLAPHPEQLPHQRPGVGPLELLRSEDVRTQAVLTRAVAQIGSALHDHRLIVVADQQGNYSIDRLYVDRPMKDETICHFLRVYIAERARQNRPVTVIRITDEDARKLAGELAELQFDRPIGQAEIYARLIAGQARLWDLPVTVCA